MLPTSRVSDNRCIPAEPSAAGRSSTGFVRRGLMALTALTILVSGFSGCTTLNNGFKSMVSSGTWNDTVISLRNRDHSAKAWHRRKHHFCNEKHNKDFAAGFRAGYEEAANGSDGCTPSFPPKEYWSWEYQSAEGSARTSAWFSGYPHGVRAAEEDGIVHWNKLPMGANLQAQYDQCAPTAQCAPGAAGVTQPIPQGHIPPGAPIDGSYPMGAPTPAYPMDNFQLPPGAQLVPGPN